MSYLQVQYISGGKYSRRYPTDIEESQMPIPNPRKV
jgi:hypothetical protein